MSRLVHTPEGEGFHDLVNEDNGRTKFLRFGLVKLKPGDSYASSTKDFEVLAVILSGTASITVDDEKWDALGGRASVFDGNPTSVYIPAQSDYEIRADTGLEIALCSAVTEERFEPFVVTPDEVSVAERGDKNWNRTVRDILTTAGDRRVSSIVVGETINHPGNWSSFPPHKHDGEFAPEEPNFEEIYHFRVQPEQGFAVQLHYTTARDIDDAYIVRDADTFVIEKGYHPLVAAGGHSVYYLWIMAGDTGRTLNPYIDPDFEWLN